MLNTDMVMVPRGILKRSMDLLGCVGCSPEGAESDARDAARLQEDIKPYAAAPPAAPAPVVREPLTDKQINNIADALLDNGGCTVLTLARAIERAHGIGGGNG